MNPDGQLQASFWVMVVAQTIGSVDLPGSGPRKMPAPGVYVPVLVVWSVLQLVADAGFERGARIAGWIIMLTGAVVGPFGAKIVGLFNTVAAMYGHPAGSGTSSGASATVTPQQFQA